MGTFCTWYIYKSKSNIGRFIRVCQKHCCLELTEISEVYDNVGHII